MFRPSLEYDSQDLEHNEAEYNRVTLEASKASTAYDFDFLVRYLVFFLEQRVPLFWNERGQIETFRILLCDEYLANAFQLKQDEIQQKDSQFRNLRWQANKRKKLLARERAASANATEIGALAGALQEECRGLEQSDILVLKAINEAAHERSELRTKLLLLKIELEGVVRKYEGLQQDYLAELFPGPDESARYVFTTLLSDNGCLVCGNRSSKGRERILHLLEHGDCPVCESPKNEQEHVVVGAAPANDELNNIAIEVKKLQRAAIAIETQEKLAVTRLQDLFHERNRIQFEWNRAREELARINAQLPPTPDALRALETQVVIDDEQLQDKAGELEQLYIEYENLIEQVNIRVSNVSNKVRTLFSEYARSFLAEHCYLGQSTYKDKVGQEREFEYPCFKVYMTSATSPDRETSRADQDDVSESQREFIDLAFRMALIAAVASSGGGAMLVIETPEASLDTYFVNQAGALLRQFGAQNNRGRRGNVVIVSSNLNRQNMIGALLGFSEQEEKWPEPDEVEKHVINMLIEAKENAAVREHRSLYEEALTEATKGRLLPRGI